MNLYSRLQNLSLYQENKVAIEAGQVRLTYAELDVRIRQIAGALRNVGVEPGDVVGVRMRETPDHMATMWACMRLGAIILPLDWRGTRKEFDRIVQRFPPKAVVGDDDPPLDWFDRAIHSSSFADSAPDDKPLAGVVDAPFVYSLTSGTTGKPKAMIVTHEQLLARCFNRTFEGVFSPDDRFLSTLPLAYPAGREHALCVLIVGATLAMFPPLFSPSELVAYVNEHGITALNLSPNISRALLGMKRADGQKLMPNLRRFVSTTGKLEPEDRAAIRGQVSGQLLDYYGSTATGPIAALARESDEHDPTAVGRPVMGMEVEVADEAGKPVAIGETGRIRVRGPAVSTPLADTIGDNDEGFRDGWFYPGDLGSFSPDGVLHLHGRAADLIKRGGLMVHAQEVEQALRRHPAVSDSAVVGAPSAELGQQVVAFVVVSEPVEAKELLRHCRSELAPFKVPARFVVVDALPRNPNGKVVKGELLKAL